MRPGRRAIHLELLVLRCQRGDKRALAELIRLWERRLFYYIRRLVDHEEQAWDILQQTWMDVLRGIGRLREPRSLSAWLYRIARNNVVSQHRIDSANPDRLDDADTLTGYEAGDDKIHFEDAEHVHCGLARLSVPHREVLTLYFLRDLSIEEIADVIGVAPGTVKSRLHYAKRALRRILER